MTQPVVIQADVLKAYQLHRANACGTDRAFLASYAGLTEPTFRKYLGIWRTRAANGRDPLTNEESADAASLLDSIGKPLPIGFALNKPHASKISKISGVLSLSHQDETVSNMRQPETAVSPEVQGLLSQLPRALRVYRKALAGGAVKPFQAKAAQDIIRAAGQLQPQKAAEKVSEFSSWPNAALSALVSELVTPALAARVDPEAPSLPDDTQAAGLPASI